MDAMFLFIFQSFYRYFPKGPLLPHSELQFQHFQIQPRYITSIENIEKKCEITLKEKKNTECKVD